MALYMTMVWLFGSKRHLAPHIPAAEKISLRLFQSIWTSLGSALVPDPMREEEVISDTHLP